MNIIFEAANWLMNNYDAVLGLIGAAHLFAVAIVNLTPTPKDDEFLAKWYPWIEKIAGLITKKAKS